MAPGRKAGRGPSGVGLVGEGARLYCHCCHCRRRRSIEVVPGRAAVVSLKLPPPPSCPGLYLPLLPQTRNTPVPRWHILQNFGVSLGPRCATGRELAAALLCALSDVGDVDHSLLSMNGAEHSLLGSCYYAKRRLLGANPALRTSPR